MKDIYTRGAEYAQSVEWLNGDKIKVQEQCRKYGYIQGVVDQVHISAKWLSENIGDAVAADYVRAMLPSHSESAGETAETELVVEPEDN